MKRFLSLGAGVQSCTVALMSARGDLPLFDGAIFADTHAEPKAVMQYLDWLEKQLPFPVYRVSRGNLRDDLLSGKTTGSIPAFTAGGGMLWRQCTRDYKIEPVRRKMRELVGKGGSAVLVMGISWDERERETRSPVKWVTHEYPLIERRLTRLHCLEYLRDRQLPLPTKSACTFCPFHDDAAWREMKANDPESWADAVDFDAKVRTGLVNIREPVFIHRSLVPLADVDLTNPAAGQLSMLDECLGMCGV